MAKLWFFFRVITITTKALWMIFIIHKDNFVSKCTLNFVVHAVVTFKCHWEVTNSFGQHRKCLLTRCNCNCFSASSGRFCNIVTFYSSWKVHCCMMLRLAGPPTQDWGGQSNVTSFQSSVGMLEICPDSHHWGASHIPRLETDLVLALVCNYTCYTWQEKISGYS